MMNIELDKPRRRGRPSKPIWENTGRTITFRLPDASWINLLQEYANRNNYEWPEALRQIFMEGMRSEGLL